MFRARSGKTHICHIWCCKNEGCPRSSKEISKIFECDSKIITKGIKNVNEILRVHKLTGRVKSDRVDSIDLITRFCNNISLNMEQIKEIIIIAENFTDKYYAELSSCTPGSLAASFIYYYVSNNAIKISKKDISENTNISVVTIQKIVTLLNNL